MSYHLSLRERIVNGLLKLILRVFCKLETTGMDTVADSGPAIMITNHTTNIEAPALYVLIQPRKATALGKAELWEKRITRFLMETWKIIPVSRGQVDSSALRASIRALKDGSLLGVAPEGTRSKSGIMKEAERGAAMLALRSGAPVYPTAQWGFSEIGDNLRRLKRTPVRIVVGRPFIVRDPDGAKLTAGALRQVADEMMYQIAKLMPERYRGFYADLTKTTTRYLEFLGGEGARAPA